MRTNTDGRRSGSFCLQGVACISGLTINATAQFKRGSPSDDPEALSTYDFDLSVLDTAQSKPIATYYKAAAFVLDGVSLREITLDTARYTLTTDLRAFGVRALSTNGSRINPMEENLLSLYVKRAKNCARYWIN
ncbi:hypothetical protein V5O39_16770 [Pseudomonas parakoreensis]